MSKDSKHFPECRKTRNYQRIIRCFADTSPRFADACQIKKYRRMFGDCWANIRRALLPTKHRQWFVKNFKASIENFGHRGNAPPRVPQVQIIRLRFGYTSRTSPDACQFPS